MHGELAGEERVLRRHLVAERRAEPLQCAVTALRVGELAGHPEEVVRGLLLREDRVALSVEVGGPPLTEQPIRTVLVEAEVGHEADPLVGVLPGAHGQPLRVAHELRHGPRRPRDARLLEGVLVVVHPERVGEQGQRALLALETRVLQKALGEDLRLVDARLAQERVEVRPHPGVAVLAHVVGGERSDHIGGAVTARPAVPG